MRLSVLLFILLMPPVVYFAISYAYVAWWHKKLFLWDTLIHENGRLTLLGSLFYFDHFLACVPMVTLFALSTAGGAVLTSRLPSGIGASGAAFLAALLLAAAVLLVAAAFFASVFTVGRQRTLDYAFQRIERDGIASKGGSWNQLQLSNIPIALGTVGVAAALINSAGTAEANKHLDLVPAGIACLGVAAMLSVTLTAVNWCGWRAFFNPRWLAHSVREIATFPLTGIPIALGSVLITENWISGIYLWRIEPRFLSLILFGMSVALFGTQLILLMRVNVLAMAQKPQFAGDGFSVPYLLCAHVFEHFLDFVLIVPMTGGIYALLRWIGLLWLT